MGTTDELLIPPVNFAMVDKGVYRSGYPNKKNLPFLHKLRLRSVVYVSTYSIPCKHRKSMVFWPISGVRIAAAIF